MTKKVGEFAPKPPKAPPAKKPAAPAAAPKPDSRQAA